MDARSLQESTISYKQRPSPLSSSSAPLDIISSIISGSTEVSPSSLLLPFSVMLLLENGENLCFCLSNKRLLFWIISRKLVIISFNLISYLEHKRQLATAWNLPLHSTYWLCNILIIRVWLNALIMIKWCCLSFYLNFIIASLIIYILI